MSQPNDRPTPQLRPTQGTAANTPSDATQTASVHRLDSYLHTHPEQIGPYRVLEVIGEGGMGVVYKAEQRSPITRIVALKLIKLGMDTKEVVARFEAERQALALMDHTNVARVFDAGATDQGRPYFVMEYVAGEPITDYCDKHKLTVRQRLELFAQVCEGVQHAHMKGIIHRDLKPTNVLVTLHDGTPMTKVIDFGIAKATQQRLTERTLFTETGRLIGTPEYMSPEQAEMSGLDVDTRTDVYALGVLLYELLTGALPFDPKSLRAAAYAEVQRIVREQDPPPPSTRLSSLAAELRNGVASARRIGFEELARQLRRELEWIPLKAMRKDRTERYRTANELADDVRNYLAGRPLMAAPESTWYRLRKNARRHRGPVIAASAVLVALLLGVTATSVALVGQTRARREAESHRQASEQQRAVAEEQRTIAEEISQFLLNMLAGTDVGGLYGDKVTVVQSVEAASQLLDAGHLKGKPLVEAAVRNTIGITLKSLDRRNQAKVHLDRALALRRGALPAGDPLIAQSLVNLADLLTVSGDAPNAEPMLLEAMAIQRAALGPNDPDVAATLNNLARALEDLRRLGEAEARYRESLQISRAAAKPEGVAVTLDNLAELLRRQQRQPEAERLLREAIEIRRKAFGPTHPRTARTLKALALVQRDLGKIDDAEASYRAAIEVQQATFTPEHPEVVTTRNNLATLLLQQGRFGEAEPILRDVVHIWSATRPRTDLDLASSMNALGELLRRQGKLEEADPLISDALARRRVAAGDDHESVGTSLMSLAMLRRDQGRLEEAESAARAARAIIEHTRRPGHAQRARVLGALGSALASQRKFEEAEPIVLECARQSLVNPAVPRAEQRESIARVIELYENWGKAQQRDHWQAELDAFERRVA
jgi:eukaryotic-like serine/threonine-protein kinase